MSDTLPPQGQWQPTQPQYPPPYTGTGQLPPNMYYPQPSQPTLPAQPFYTGPEVYQQFPPPPPPPIPPPPPPPSRTRTFVIASIIILVAVVGNILVFGNRIGISLPTASAPQHYKVGQSAQVDNYTVTLKSVQAALPSSMYNDLNDQADRYFIALVSVKNTGSQAQVIDQSNFILRDLTGQAYELAYDPDAPVSITGEATPNETISGSVVYEIPRGVSLFTLSFQPDLTAPDQLIWDASV